MRKNVQALVRLYHSFTHSNTHSLALSLTRAPPFTQTTTPTGIQSLCHAFRHSLAQ